MRRPASGIIVGSLAVLAASLFLGVAPSTVGAASGPPGFLIENAFPTATFFAPVEIVFLPDGRRFVVEQGGNVWVLSPAGEKLSTPFIDLSTKVLFNPSSGRGLLGVALDPDFTANRWVYFSYTVDPDSNAIDNEEDAYSRIERYQVDTVNPNTADLSTRQVLIGVDWASGIPCADTYHSIGALRFGADKTLLASSGDGAHFSSTDAGGLDPGEFGPGKDDPAHDIGSFRSQSIDNLNGKILRIDKETGHGLPSNPFWNGDSVSARSRIWVYGVRNPYRFTVRPGTGSTDPSLGRPGTLYIGDTGWNNYESVHIATQGGGTNHGWPCREGAYAQPLYGAVSATATGNTNVLCGAPNSGENPAPYTPPPIWWSHNDGAFSNPPGWTGNAVIGGGFQSGGNFPAPYLGAFYAVDFIQGWIRWIQMDSTNHVASYGNFVTGVNWPVNVENDPASGDLYVVSYSDNMVLRIRYQPVAAAKSVTVRADSANGSGPYPIPGAGSPWKDVVSTHDFTLRNFSGTTSSGWQGAGSVTSPYQLKFDGLNDAATIAGASITELQTAKPVAAALWFHTGADVNGTQYLMWWGTAYSSSSAGMNNNINNGQLRVRFGTTQTNIAAVGPNRWYHVLVSKDSSGNQVYINGQLSFSGSTFSLGRQQTEVVLGASEFMANSFTNCFKGSIAQATIWPSRLSATDAMVIYQSGEALFVPSATQALLLRADSANVTGPYPRPGAGSPWFDLANQHDATLVNFNADSTSGWQGNGTLSSPYRLAFDGVDDRVVIAAGTIPELQSVSTVSAAVWFHTGSDVTTNQCLLEWLGEYTPPFSGMSMVISGGYFRVMLDTWVDAMPVLPNAWYYMTVTKQPGTARIYVNGARCYTGGFANLGDQNSELVIGASTHAGAGVYGDYFRGSIAQVTVWRKALLDPEVQEAFHNDAAFFFGSGLEAHVVELRADSADGTTHYPKPGAASPWVDLARDHDATLIGFRGDGISGWSGDGMNWPYCLMFDGNGGCVTIPGGSVPELQQLTEASVSLWLHTGPDLIRKQYVLEWLQEYVDPYRGMTVRIVDGNLNVFLGGAQMLQALQPYTWYHVVVTKEPGVSRLYLNGQVVKSSSSVSLGNQLSEIVIGASTFRGAGIHGEFFDGAIAQAGVWPVALTGAQVLTLFRADSVRYVGPHTVDATAPPVTALLPPRPNPFTRTLALSFSLARPGRVDVAIYGVDGRRVRTLAGGKVAAGMHRLTWDGRGASGQPAMPGVYFVRLNTPEKRLTTRVVRLR